MTTYNGAAVSNTAIAFQKPITLQQGRALRDNPIATSEGANGSPYVAAGWHPHDGVTVGDGADGLIYDFAVDGAVASIETPSFVDGYEYMLEWSNLKNTSATPDFLIAFYRATSAAYSATTLIDTGLASSIVNYGYIILRKPMVTSRVFVFDFSNEQAGSDATAVSSEDMGVIKHTTAQKVSKARLSLSVSTFGGGKIYMHKRRCYAAA